MKPGLTGTGVTAELVKDLLGASGTANYRGIMVARIPFNATSTANAATNWINPETGTVAARVYVVFTTAGTGTLEVGRSSDGTGSAVTMWSTGTMTVGVHQREPTASGTAGALDPRFTLLGPGGTGTNNSIVMKHSDTTASTAVGAMCVEYFLIGV